MKESTENYIEWACASVIVWTILTGAASIAAVFKYLAG